MKKFLHRYDILIIWIIGSILIGALITKGF